VIHLHPDDPPLTVRETARVTALVARMAKRSIAGEDVDLSDLQNQVDRILDKARDRQQQNNQNAKPKRR
jgi:hypothetical protein